MKLDTKLLRVSISDDIWFSGDGVLLDANIALGENERSSTCSISVYDPKLAIGSKYQKISIQQGGILVPDDLITSPKGTGTGGAATNEPGTLQTSGGGNEQENIKLIVAECIKQGVTDPKQIAYVLGTAQHESGFAPVSEIDGLRQEGTIFYGRGFVQLTHQENYAKYSKKLGKDLVGNPDLVKEPRIAAFILVDGMKNGVFTGVKLGDFIGGGKADYTSARTIVNGTDRASLIAGYATDWEKKVPGLMGGNTNLQPPTPTTSTSTAPTTAPKVDPPQTETSSKGTEIIVEIGFSSTKKLIAFHFIHVGTQTSLGGGSKTTFEGKSIRWLLTRVPQTKSYEQVSLKDIASAVAKSYGMDLKMEGIGPRYEHLDQTGLTPLELLRRETSKIGYRVADDKSTLIIEPEGRPHFSNFVVDEDSLISIVFTDKARGSKAIPFQKIADAYSSDKDTKFVLDRRSGQIQQFKNETFIGTPEASAKTAPVTGKPSTVAAGILKPSLNYGSSPTGFTDNIIGGQYAQDPIKVEKSDSTDDAGNKIHREKTTELSRKRGSIITSVTEAETRTIGAVVTPSNIVTTTQKDIVFLGNTDTVIKQTIVVTRNANGVGSITNSESTTIDADLQATLKLGYTPPPSSDNYGLPKQIPGILDLEDGKAEAQVISDEANRIKGYESTVKLRTNQEILQIVPGEIIGLSGRLFPDPFDREWRVYSVAHSWEPNTTTLIVYTPQGLKKGEVSSEATPGSSSPGAIPAGDYMYPCHGFIITSLKGMRTNPVSGAYRLHAGTDIGCPEGTPVQAAGNGKCTVAEVESGYGNIIRIDHGGGIITGYAHLSAMKVQVGATVTKGQVIGVSGNTGVGTGAHLHWEVYVNGECVTPSSLKLAEPVLGMTTP